MASGSDTYLLTIGEVGAGKTYKRCPVYLLDEFLPNGDEDSVHWSNFPIMFDDRWKVGDDYFDDEEEARAVGDPEKVLGLVSLARARNFSEETVRRRIRVIPPDVVERCRNAKLGRKEEPYCFWHWFESEGISLSKCQVAIDEIHVYCGKRSNPKVREAYEAFLGAGRHTGSTWEFLTQAPDKVAPCIEIHATSRILIEKGEKRRDPWFKISNYDWYQIRYLVTRRYNPTSWITEQNKQITGSRAKWVDGPSHFFWFKPEYFGAYDSYSLLTGTGGLVGVAAQPECMRFSPLRLVSWFMVRNWWRFLWNATTVSICFIVLMVYLARAAQDGSFLAMVETIVKPADKEEEKEPPKIRSVSKLKGRGASRSFTPAAEPDLVSVLDPSLKVYPGSEPLSVSSDLAEEPESVLNAEQQKEQERLREEVNQLQRRLDESSAIMAISGNKVFIRDGGTYAVGERIKFGVYQGRTIEKIEFSHRAIMLDDGTWLRLGSRVESAAERIKQAINPASRGASRIESTVTPGDSGK